MYGSVTKLPLHKGLHQPQDNWGTSVCQATSGSLTVPGKISRTNQGDNKAGFIPVEKKKEAQARGPLGKKRKVQTRADEG